MRKGAGERYLLLHAGVGDHVFPFNDLLALAAFRLALCALGGVEGVKTRSEGEGILRRLLVEVVPARREQD